MPSRLETGGKSEYSRADRIVSPTLYPLLVFIYISALGNEMRLCQVKSCCTGGSSTREWYLFNGLPTARKIILTLRIYFSSSSHFINELLSNTLKAKRLRTNL